MLKHLLALLRSFCHRRCCEVFATGPCQDYLTAYGTMPSSIKDPSYFRSEFRVVESVRSYAWNFLALEWHCKWNYDKMGAFSKNARVDRRGARNACRHLSQLAEWTPWPIGNSTPCFVEPLSTDGECHPKRLLNASYQVFPQLMASFLDPFLKEFLTYWY